MSLDEIALRKLNSSHIPLFYEWWNDRELRQLTSGVYTPMSKEDIDKRISDCILDSNRNDFIIYVGDKAVGHILIEKPKRKKNFEIYVAIGEKDYWNKGVGSVALKKAMNWFFKNYPKETSIDLEVNLDNSRAIRCYEKVGFVKIKKKYHKKYPNTYLMRLVKE